MVDWVTTGVGVLLTGLSAGQQPKQVALVLRGRWHIGSFTHFTNRLQCLVCQHCLGIVWKLVKLSDSG